MYVTKEDREVIAKTIRAVVEDVYKTPKYYEANDVILSPTRVSEEFPFITQPYSRGHRLASFVVNSHYDATRFFS